MPGVGPVLASALVATVADPRVFRSGRDLAAWIGLVPRQNSSGGKERLGSINKAGHRHLRQMLVVGSMAVIRYATGSAKQRPWLAQLLGRKKKVALANKIARTVWAMMITGERYREPLAVGPTVNVWSGWEGTGAASKTGPDRPGVEADALNVRPGWKGDLSRGPYRRHVTL